MTSHQLQAELYPLLMTILSKVLCFTSLFFQTNFSLVSARQKTDVQVTVPQL